MAGENAGGTGGAAASGAQGAGPSPGAAAGPQAAAASGTGAASANLSGQNAGGAQGAPPSTPAAAPDWTTGLDDGHKGLIQGKGWKGAKDAIDSYQNLEKLVGAPPDQIIRMAKEDDAAGWDSIYTRLGKPATPEGYGIEAPKDGGNPEFAKWAATEFHKAGLNSKQAKTVVEGWNNYLKAQTAAQTETTQAQVTADTTALRKEWGAAYDQQIQMAQRAAREFGVDGKTVDAIQSAVGFKGVMKFFSAIGAKLGEAPFVSGNGNHAEGIGGVMTPPQAQHQIKVLKSDVAFVKKYTSGDVAAQEKMAQLHKMAYPDS